MPKFSTVRHRPIYFKQRIIKKNFLDLTNALTVSIALGNNNNSHWEFHLLSLGFAVGGTRNSSSPSGDNTCVSSTFVIAYLHSGQIYQWGFIPWTGTTLLEAVFVHKLDNKVVEVACGYSHCVALCENGQVSNW